MELSSSDVKISVPQGSIHLSEVPSMSSVGGYDLEPAITGQDSVIHATPSIASVSNGIVVTSYIGDSTKGGAPGSTYVSNPVYGDEEVKQVKFTPYTSEQYSENVSFFVRNGIISESEMRRQTQHLNSMVLFSCSTF